MKLIGLNKQIKYGEPWKLNPEATTIVVPILTLNNKGMRGYKLYSEVEDSVIVEDINNINTVKIINNSKYPVFFKKGLIISGGNTQERAFVDSVIVRQGSTMTAKVNCIHASKGIRKGAKFGYGGFTPESVTRNLHKGQSDTWGSVSAFTAMTSDGDSLDTENTRVTARTQSTPIRGLISSNRRNRSPIIGATLSSLNSDRTSNVSYLATSTDYDSIGYLDTGGYDVLGRGTDDLVGHLNDSGDEIEQALANLPANHEDQIGIAIIDSYGVRAFEIFDSPGAWEALSQVVVKNYSNILNNVKENGIDINHETAYKLLNEFIEYVKKMDGKRVNGNSSTGTYAFKDHMIVGEFTKLTGFRMHVLVNRLVNKSFPTSFVISKRYGQSVVKDNPKSPVDEQMEAAFKINFLSKKRGYSTTASIVDGNKTFGNIQRDTGMSSKSVAEALKEGVLLGLIYKTGNQYELTSEGESLDPKRFKRAFGR